MRIRWFVLTCGIIFVCVACLKGEIIDAAIAFAVGMFGGFFLDCLGVSKMRLWHYPRQPFLGLKYFAIVVPAWGVLGMVVNLLWNWLSWMGLPWFPFLVLTAVLFMLHELPNLKTRSWRYNAPMWAVGCGWLPLIMFFRVLFVMAS